MKQVVLPNEPRIHAPSHSIKVALDGSALLHPDRMLPTSPRT